MDNLISDISKKYDTFLTKIHELLKTDIDNLLKKTSEEKYKNSIDFYNKLDNEDLFLLFSRSKIKVFSSKTEETYQLSKSLFGEDLTLKMAFNNQTETTKRLLWIRLFYIYDNLESNRKIIKDEEPRESRLEIIKDNITSGSKNVSNDLKGSLIGDDVNETTNNMFDDIVGSFTDVMNNNDNPFDNIMNITSKITEKYQDKLSNGDIEIDKIMSNLTSKMPNMDNLNMDNLNMGNLFGNDKKKEKVVMDENFSTADIELGKEEESKGGLNFSNVMNMANKIPNMSKLTNIMSKMNDDDNLDEVKNEMDSLLENEFGFDMTKFNEQMQEISEKLENDNLKDKVVED